MNDSESCSFNNLNFSAEQKKYEHCIFGDINRGIHYINEMQDSIVYNLKTCIYVYLYMQYVCIYI